MIFPLHYHTFIGMKLFIYLCQHLLKLELKITKGTYRPIKHLQKHYTNTTLPP